MNFNNLSNLERAKAWYRANPGGGGVTYPSVLDDGNTVAWFDYTENITKDGSNLVSVWGDKSGLSHDLLQATGTNQPLATATGILFDGVDNFMKTAAFTLVQPEFIYMVVKQVSWTDIDRFFDGDAISSGTVYQRTASPNILAYSGTSASADNSNLSIGTYGILRVLFNGVASKIQVNETAAITGNFGALGMGGFTLGSRATSDSPGNIEVKEVIIRKVADVAASEAAIYSYLASKYSI